MLQQWQQRQEERLETEMGRGGDATGQGTPGPAGERRGDIAGQICWAGTSDRAQVEKRSGV
eukprot:5387512-Prymnesium_polylepis.1